MICTSPTWVDRVNQWLGTVGDYALHKLLPVLGILIVGLLLIRLIMTMVDRFLSRSTMEKAAHRMIKTFVRVVLYILLVLTVVSGLGIDVSGLLALFSVLTLAISLAVQNALTNLISGFMLIYTDPFSSGDFVEVGGQSGTVHEIGLTYTKLLTADGKFVYIPNGAVTSAEIVNYTVLGKRRVDVTVSASYDAPVDTVLAALEEAADLPTTRGEEGISAVVDNYGDSAISYTVRIWVNTADYWSTLCELKKNVKKVFDEKGIEMSYPHLNVHLDK